MTCIWNPSKKSGCCKDSSDTHLLFIFSLSMTWRRIFKLLFIPIFIRYRSPYCTKPTRITLVWVFQAVPLFTSEIFHPRLASLIWVAHLCWKWESKLICFLHLSPTVSELIFTIWWRKEVNIFLWLWLSWTHYFLFHLVSVKSKHW